ncbi:MAG: efflux RND transporter periplasmic adaptor subunit [Armatimonadetes bacterium]|nr:efflux RND transporter periplasmic adaptor subunit [Candidatus Hippobium faecium]
MKRKIIPIIILILVVAVLAFAGFARSKNVPSKTIDQVQEAEGFPIEVGNIRIGDLQQTVELTGTVKPLDKQIITCKVNGKVDFVNFREGDAVKKGQVILQLEQDNYRDALKQAKMSLNQQKASLSQAIVDKKNTAVQTDAGVKSAKLALQTAKENLKLAQKPYRNQQIIQAENSVNTSEYNYNQAKRDAARFKSLYEKGAVSLSDYENMKLKEDVAKKNLDNAKEQLSLVKEQGREEEIRRAQLSVQSAEESLRQAKSNAITVAMKDESIKMAQAAVASAQAAVDTAQDNLNNTVVVAKIDGIMSKRSVEPGQTIGSGIELGEIVSLKDMYYLANVSEMDIDEAEEGKHVDVVFDALEDEVFSGAIAVVYPVAEETTKNYSVKVKLNNYSNEIKAGMFARGLLDTEIHKNVMIVPMSSVRSKQGIDSIFVVDTKENTVKQVSVEIVSKYIEDIEIRPIKSGALKGNEKIAVAGIDSLSDGSKIQIGTDK